MSNKPRVSIIITTYYKRSCFIGKAIASVLAQTYRDYELIVIDDSPSREIENIVRQLDNGGHIIYHRNDPPLGLFQSANYGLRLARGEYIARIDDDDVWLDDCKLEKQVQFLDTHPEYVLVGTGMISLDEGGNILAKRLLPENDDKIRDEMLTQNCFAHPSVMFKTSAVMAVGGYSEARRPYSEDYDLWLKLGTNGKLANLPIYGLGYTHHNRSIRFIFRERFIVALKDLNLCTKYCHKYPNYRHAVHIRLNQIFNLFLSIVTDIPPLVHIKRYVKHKLLNTR